MSEKKRILFVCHEATRTGAPIILLNFLKWVKTHRQNDVEFKILIKDGGDLECEFRELAEVYSLTPNYSVLKKLVNRITGRYKIPYYKNIPEKLLREKFDLIYLNTAASNYLAPLLKEHIDCPVVSHIHENEFTLQNYYPEALNDVNTQKINCYIAASTNTKHNLIKKHGIDPSAISVVHEFVELDKFSKPSRTIESVKKDLNIENDFIIGGSGLSSWRKGIDLFVRLAYLVKDKYPEEAIKFIWVGYLSPNFKAEFEYESERLGIDNILFTEAVKDPNNYFQVFDLFVLTSREDPFPLVCLEAASLGKPVICFDQSGGMPEFAEQCGSRIIPYANVELLAEAVIELKHNDEQRKQLSDSSKETVKNFDINVQAPKIWTVITNLLDSTNA